MDNLIRKDLLAQGATFGRQEMLEDVLDVILVYRDYIEEDMYKEMIKDLKCLV